MLAQRVSAGYGEREIAEHRRSELWAYMAGICQQNGPFVHVIGGVEDRVYALIHSHYDACVDEPMWDRDSCGCGGGF